MAPDISRLVDLSDGRIAMTRSAQSKERWKLNSCFRRYFPLYSGLFLALLGLTGLVMLARPQFAGSFLVGGLIHFTAALCFAFSVFRRPGATSSQQFLLSFYRGEVLKFILTALGFFLAFSLFDALVVPALFAGFVLMMVLHTITLACVSN